MVEATKSLDTLSSAIADVDRSLGSLEKTKLEVLAGSKGWTALSRLVSGVFPAFWSIQNKVRGTIDILRIIEKRGETAFENAQKASAQISKISKNYSDVLKFTDALKSDPFKIKEMADDLIFATRMQEQLQNKLEASKLNYAEDLGIKFTNDDFAAMAMYGEQIANIKKKQKEFSEDSPFVKEMERMTELFGTSISPEQAKKLIMSEAATLKQMATSDVVKMGGRETEQRSVLEKRINKLQSNKGLFGQNLSDAQREELKKLNKLFKASEKRDKEFIRRFKIRQFKNNMRKLGAMAAKFLAFFVVATVAFAILIRFFKEYGGSIMESIKEVYNSFIKPLFMTVKEIFSLAIAAFSDAWSYFEDEKYLEALISLLASVGLFLTGLIMAAVAIVSSVVMLIFAIIKGVLVAKLETAGNKLSAVVGTIKEIFLVIAAIAAVAAFFVSGAWIVALVAGIGAVILAGIEHFVDKIPGFASGGVSRGGLAVVGERGPELVNLPNGSRVHSNADSRQMVGGTNTINVYVQGRVGASDQEIRELAKKVGEEISRNISRFTSSGVFNRG